MAITVVNAYTPASSFGTTLSATITAPTAGNTLLVIATLSNNPANFVSVTTNLGATATVDFSGYGGIQKFCRFSNVTAAPTSIILTTSLADSLKLVVLEVSGLANAAPDGSATLTSPTGYGTSHAYTVNVPAAGDFAVGNFDDGTGSGGNLVSMTPAFTYVAGLIYAESQYYGIASTAGSQTFTAVSTAATSSPNLDLVTYAAMPTGTGSFNGGGFYSGAFDVPASGAYTLTAVSGSLAITGKPQTILKSRILTASAGSYTLSGVAQSVRRNKVLNASAGSYAITGVPQTITYTPVVPSGAYTLTALAGSYSLTGVSQSVLRHRVLSASPGTYAITGVNQSIKRNKVLSASSGTYSLTGVAQSLLKSKVLVASAGSYSITGVAQSIRRNKVLNASAGSYTVVGQTVNIIHTSSGPVWPLPSNVLAGITYGPTGTEYVGTYTDGIRLELSTGRLVKPIGSRASLLI